MGGWFYWISNKHEGMHHDCSSKELNPSQNVPLILHHQSFNRHALSIIHRCVENTRPYHKDNITTVCQHEVLDANQWGNFASRQCEAKERACERHLSLDARMLRVS